MFSNFRWGRQEWVGRGSGDPPPKDDMVGRVQTKWQTCWSVAKAPRDHCHSGGGRRKSDGAGRKGQAMPAVGRLGRASPSLSVWLGAAAPEEIKKCPGVVVDGDGLCLGSGKTRGEKKYFRATERTMESKNSTRDFFENYSATETLDMTLFWRQTQRHCPIS